MNQTIKEYFEENGKNEVKYVKAASRLFKKVEENNFDHPEIWFELASVKSYLGYFESAKKIYQKINNYFPDNISTKLNL